VHDTLERYGWGVQVADAIKVKGLAPLACKTDRIDAWVLAELSRRELVPAIWLPSFAVRQERERARWRLHLVKHRSALKQRIHAQLMAFGYACPVTDLFGVKGRELLAGLDFPEPWCSDVLAALALIDTLEREIAGIEREPAGDRPRGRLGARLHDRLRDRRHRPVRDPWQARRVHRPVPSRLPVRR